MSFRIRIIQRWIPEYRVAVFNGVGIKFLGEVELWAAAQDKGVSYIVENVKMDYSHTVKRWGPVQWQHGLITLKGLKKGDVIVVGGDLHNISAMMLSALARMNGLGVVWWGHHKTANAKRWKVLIRLWIAKLLSDVYLCYTKAGARFLETHGFVKGRVYATGNTIDQTAIVDAVGKFDKSSLDDFRHTHNLEGKKLILICGEVHAKMRLHQLIEAMATPQLRSEPVVLAVIGDGSECERCRALSKRLCVDDRIRWIGATRDQMVMAPWFILANVFVYPGAIGLSIMHAFSYGVPVVTHGCREHQMPEFEALREGVTGLTFREDDVNDLADKVLSMIVNPKRTKEMGDKARKLAFSEYSMRQMVENYCAAIIAAHKFASSMASKLLDTVFLGRERA